MSKTFVGIASLTVAIGMGSGATLFWGCRHVGPSADFEEETTHFEDSETPTVCAVHARGQTLINDVK